MTDLSPNEKSNLDNLVLDLRSDMLEEAPPALDTKNHPPQAGKEVRMGGRLPRWVYHSGMGLAGAILLFVMITLVIQVSKPLASYTDTVTDTNEMAGLPATELPLPTPEIPSLPPPPTPGAFPDEPSIPLPVEEPPLLPEPTEIPPPPPPSS